MRRIFFIAAAVLICFVIESVLGQILGRWFKPNLSISLIVFLNLFRGSNPSIMAAFMAGLMRDSFSAKFFGLNIFSFVACANLTTFFKMYLYETGSMGSRVLILFLIAVINILIQYAVNAMLGPVFFKEVIRYVLLPEVLATTLAAPYVFTKFKKCALRFFA